MSFTRYLYIPLRINLIHCRWSHRYTSKVCRRFLCTDSTVESKLKKTTDSGIKVSNDLVLDTNNVYIQENSKTHTNLCDRSKFKKVLKNVCYEESPAENIKEHLRDMCDRRLISFLFFLREQHKIESHGMDIYNALLSAIENECAIRIKFWDPYQILHVLSVVNHFKNDHRRSINLNVMMHLVNFDAFHVNHLVQLIYHLGCTKLSFAHWITDFEKTLENCRQQLNLEQISIVFHSYFKCKQKIASQRILEHASEVVISSINGNSNADSHQIVNIIKLLRFNGYFNKRLYKLFGNYICEQVSTLNVASLAHFLSFYSGMNYYSKRVFDAATARTISLLLDGSESDHNLLNKISVTDLRQIHPLKRARVKDISRFLWSVSVPRHKFRNDELDVLERIIRERLNYGEYQQNPEKLVDSLVSLVICERYPKDLINIALSPEFVKSAISIGKSKPFVQLYFIDGSIAIELPSYSGNRLTEKHVNDCFIKNPRVPNKWIKMIKAVLDNRFNSQISHCLTYNIPHIRIAAIDLYPKHSKTGQKLSIEVLDESFCLQNNNRANGIFKCKLRQLDKLGIQYKMLLPSDIKYLMTLQRKDQFNVVMQFVDKCVDVLLE